MWVRWSVRIRRKAKAHMLQHPLRHDKRGGQCLHSRIARENLQYPYAYSEGNGCGSARSNVCQRSWCNMQGAYQPATVTLSASSFLTICSKDCSHNSIRPYIWLTHAWAHTHALVQSNLSRTRRDTSLTQDARSFSRPPRSPSNPPTHELIT